MFNSGISTFLASGDKNFLYTRSLHCCEALIKRLARFNASQQERHY